MVADMWALYRIDVTQPFRVPLVRSLLERLQNEPYSMWRANSLGGPEWFGWGIAEVQRADLIDRASMTAKTAGKQAKLKDDEKSPRPSGREEKRVVSTRDWKSVQALYGG